MKYRRLPFLILGLVLIAGFSAIPNLRQSLSTWIKHPFGQKQDCSPHQSTQTLHPLASLQGPTAEYTLSYKGGWLGRNPLANLKIVIPFAEFGPQLSGFSPDVAEKMRESVSSSGAVIDTQNYCKGACTQVFIQAMLEDRAVIYDAGGKQVFDMDHVNASAGCGMNSSATEYLVLPGGSKVLISMWVA